MRGNLLRAVSHDIRTPLTSIVGGVSTLLDSGDQLNEATRTQLLENIRDESNWLVSVVENLLSVTRMTGEQTKIKKEMEAGEEVLSAAAMKIKKHYPDIDVSVHAPQELLMIPMDVILIEQVLINLMKTPSSTAGRPRAWNFSCERTASARDLRSRTTDRASRERFFRSSSRAISRTTRN